MKMFTNLPNLLRSLFSFLRVMSLIMAVFWLLTLTFNAWIQRTFGHDAKFIATVGEIALPAAPGALGLASNTASPGSLTLHALRGTLQVDLASNDAALASAFRQAIFPSMAVLIFFAYVLFTALRDVCGNLGRGEVFNEANLRLVRRIGAVLIAYSLIGAALEFWASHILGGYFNQHVVLTGLKASLPFPGGPAAQFFKFPVGLFSAWGGLLAGCLVLVVAEAFRQGLNLKTENDLTV